MSQRKERHEGPDVVGLATQYRDAVGRRDSSYWERQRVNYETRYCVWPNQSWDGRKWKRRDGKRTFPWIGASDARVPLADHYIRTDVTMLMEAWRTQRIQVRSTSPARGGGNATQLTTLLRWQIYEDMEEAEGEAELLANLYLERGAAAVGIFWDQRSQMTRETLRMAEIEAAAQRAAQALAQGARGPHLEMQAAMPALVLDPAMEPQAVALLQSFLGASGANMKEARVARILRDLRETGEGAFPVPVVIRDRPTIRALAWNEDIFMPPTASDMASVPVVFHRELLTETELQERTRVLGYDADWVDEVIETQRGKVSSLGLEEDSSRSARPWGRGAVETEDLYEVATAFRRMYDEDDVPAIWTTTFAPGNVRIGRRRVRQDEDATPAKHEILDYAHGMMPFQVFQVERRSRLVDDSRGYGERAHTLQQQIKKQWDARTDRADVATLPPSYHPPGEEPEAWGPGVQIPTLQHERFGYFDIPKFDMGSKEVEETVRTFADEYFGRRMEGSDGVDATNLRQHLVSGWLKGWKGVFRQVLALDQQYLPNEVYARVVGSDQGQAIRVTREEIQGAFNVSLNFAVKNLDMEYLVQMIGMLNQVLAIDVSGRVDRDELVTAAFELLDPAWGERLLKPGQQASLEQMEDEKMVLAQLLLGIPVDVRGDEAFGLRKQVLMSTVQQSPTVNKLLQANPQAMEMVMTRLKQLDFNIQQREVNPDIGRRLGTKPMEKAMAAGGAQ